MDVNSVSSTVSSFAPPQNGRADQTQRAPAADEPERAPERNRETAGNEERKPPEPVVNAQGQTTGRVVNTSA